MKHLIINLIGAKASGKTTLAKELGFPIVITTTTRQPRKSETNNDYNFVSVEEYNKNEYIMPTKINNNFYGVNKEIFESMHNKYKVITIVTDLEGTKYLKEKYNEEVISVLVVACKDEINKRLLERDEVRTNLTDDYNYSVASNYADMILLNNTKDDLLNNKSFIIERVNKIEHNESLF